MGDTPSTPAPPATPDYAAANREGVQANFDYLGPQRQLEALARSGGKGTVKVPQMDGDGNIRWYEDREYDFTGLGDTDYAKQQQDSALGLADTAAGSLLDLQRKYGADYVTENRKQQELADPEAFKSRQLLGTQINEDLALGDQLSDSQRRNVEQQTRKAQVARGNLLGDNPAIDEAIATSGYGEQLKQQRQANAQAFNTLQPLAQYNAAAAQTGAAPYQPIGAGAQYSNNVNPNAGAQGTSFASNVYGTTAGIYSNQLAASQNQSNPWMTGLGTLGGIGATLGAGVLSACWVAREVFGIRDPRWQIFRRWLFTKAPSWLRLLYLKHGMQFAGVVRKNPWMKLVLKPMMKFIIRNEAPLCQELGI